MLQKLKNEMNFKEKLIKINWIKRLLYRIYNWYVDGDHLLLRFILGRGSFRNNINDKCILCKNCDNIK